MLELVYYSTMSRIDQLTDIIRLLDETSDEGYPDLRQSIITNGEVPTLPYNPFALGMQLAGHDPATIERGALRACLCAVLQIAYANAWLA